MKSSARRKKERRKSPREGLERRVERVDRRKYKDRITGAYGVDFDAMSRPTALEKVRGK